MYCSDMKIISVIVGMYYKEVTNEWMRYVKVWKESKNLLLLLTSDKLILACGTLLVLKKPSMYLFLQFCMFSFGGYLFTCSSVCVNDKTSLNKWLLYVQSL